MSRLPHHLRLFWAAYLLLLLAFVGLAAGPTLETALWPVRSKGATIEGEGRDRAFVRFTWVSRKLRMTPSPGVDAVMDAAGDRFDLTLYNDVSGPNEAPCTRLLPWSRSLVVGVGEHRQAYCVEIPRTVAPSDAIGLTVTAKYRGLWGLWTLAVPLPPLVVPGG